MKLDADTWARVSVLFDRIADLPPEQREDTLERERPDPEVRRWLLQLLAAHDTPDDLLIDRTLHGVVEALDPAAGRDEEARLPERVGPWRLAEELGRGGMGRVMLAERADGGYQQRVALKLIDQQIGRDGAEALRREVHLLARLEHPGIVRLIDADLSVDAQPYLAMEHVEGERLEVWCEASAPSLDQRIDLLRQVGAALIHAHGRLVVHVDLKPSNVLVDRQGRARLLDFGIGRWLREQESGLGARLRCSPAWCAPEQLQGAGADVAQDVFGLGALAWHLLTGRRVREGNSITHWLIGRPVTDADLPAASTAALPELDATRIRGDLDAIVQRALDSDPARRYASIEAMDQDLGRWQAGLPVAARPLNRAQRLSRWLIRHRVPAAAAGIALIALVGGLIAAQTSARIARAAAEQARIEAQRTDTVKDFFLETIRSAYPLRAGGPEMDLRDVLTRAADSLSERQDLDVSIRAEILNTLADIKRSLGWTDEAREHVEAAMALAAGQAPIDALIRAETLVQHALLDAEATRLDPAVMGLAEAHELLRAIDTEPARRLRARALVQWGATLARLNRIDEARMRLDEAESIVDTLDPPDLERRMLLTSARGLAAHNAGDLEQAYRFMADTLRLQLQLGNADEPSMVMTYSNLAGVASRLGRMEEALEHDRQALALARRVYPAGHTQVGWSLYGLGSTLRQLGRYDEALRDLDEARAIQAAHGRTADVALIDLNRARTLLSLGRYQDAVSVLVEAKPILAETWGEGSRETLQGLDVEIAARSALGDRDRLAPLRFRAGEIVAGLPEERRWLPLAQNLRWRLGHLAWSEGRLDDALRWLQEARNAPEHASAVPTVELRLDALAARLMAAGALQSSEELFIALERGVERPDANNTARAYAWSSVLLAEEHAGEIRADSARMRLQELLRTGSPDRIETDEAEQLLSTTEATGSGRGLTPDQPQ